MNRPRRNVLSTARQTLAAYVRTYEDGVTAAIFAVALLVLLGMVALGIDGGRIYDERRQAQNAADHAAIAAAFASCEAGAVADVAAAIAKGEDSAELNGYVDDADSSVLVEHDGAADVHRYTARIDTRIGTTFAQVIGFATLDTNAFARAEATGCDASGASSAAVWAGGHDCPGGSLRNVEISGNDHIVNGLTYSNGSYYNGGNDSVFTNTPDPAVKYVGSFNGGSNTYSAAQQQVPLPATADRWPGGFDPSVDMTDAMWDAYKAVRVNSSATASSFSIVANGVYYTERTSGDIEVSSIVTGARFVVVSKFRPIKIPNDLSGRVFHAYDSPPAGTPANVILVSGFTHSQPCDQFAFERSGEGGTWNGLFWTPRAMSRWSGNFGTINGGFVTWAFQMNGNNHTINGGTGNPAAEPDVLLLN